MIKQCIMMTAVLVMSTSLAHAAGKTEVTNINQQVEMSDRAKITAIPNSAGGGIKAGPFGASGGASYNGGVEINSIDASGGAKVDQVDQTVKVRDRTEISGTSVKINSIKATD